MRQYGCYKSTEFTAKQISVVYYKAKSGELKVEKWFMQELYNLADYCGYDDNRSVEFEETKVKQILEAVFAKNTQKAQELIDHMEDDMFERFSRKNQAKCDRTLFVK